MKIVYSQRFLEHSGFPESPERLTAIINYLEKKGIGKKHYIQPEKVKEKDLLLVHSQELLNELKKRSKAMNSTPDNLFEKNTFEIAKLSAGAALTAARLAKKEFAFSLGRPPGHHAGINSFAGFCYLNNIAFAVRKVQCEGLAKKVLIIDFDVHHGQGTQEIFSGNNSVFYLSFHQNPSTIYPWINFPPKDKTTRNIIIEPGTTDSAYLSAFNSETEKVVSELNPDLIAVSAGFDIFYTDTIVGSALKIKKSTTFHELGKKIASFKIPAFGVLEGGYSLSTLGENVFNFLKAFY